MRSQSREVPQYGSWALLLMNLCPSRFCFQSVRIDPMPISVAVANHCAWRRLIEAIIMAMVPLALFTGLPSQAASNVSTTSDNDERDGEYRLTLFPYHRISDDWTGFGYLGYVNNPDKEYQTAYLGYGGSYAINKSIQLWGGLIGTYTANRNSSDKLELRPFVGPKFFLPNDWKWNIYNWTRYEFRDIQDLDSHQWTEIHRIRSRFGVEIPLTSRENAWQPKTFYALADVEPFYRFDKDTIDPLRVRGGIAYIINSRVRVEFIYHAQFTRPVGSRGLEFTDNILRLNFKIALDKGIFSRIADGGDAGD